MIKFAKALLFVAFTGMSACGSQVDQRTPAAAAPETAAPAATTAAPAATITPSNEASLIYVDLGGGNWGWNCGYNNNGRLIRVDLGACNGWNRWRR